jgi:DNA-binding LacI/PurR family transcriptional regulator
VERAFYASQAIQAAGYNLFANEILWSDEKLSRAVDMMLDAHAEGVVLAGVVPDLGEAAVAKVQRLRDAKIPIVVMAGVRFPDIPYVTTDYRQGMAALTEHVLSLGYRTLALVSAVRSENSASPNEWGFAERLAGFREATAAAGLSPAEARVLHQPLTAGWTDSYAPGQAAIRSLTESGERPEALLCSNDEMAIGAIRACAEAGWRVPNDIAVTGFDNTTAGRYACPALTTVAQPTEAVAKRAVELLLQQMREDKKPPKRRRRRRGRGRGPAAA